MYLNGGLTVLLTDVWAKSLMSSSQTTVGMLPIREKQWRTLVDWKMCCSRPLASTLLSNFPTSGQRSGNADCLFIMATLWSPVTTQVAKSHMNMNPCLKPHLLASSAPSQVCAVVQWVLEISKVSSLKRLNLFLNTKGQLKSQEGQRTGCFQSNSLLVQHSCIVGWHISRAVWIFRVTSHSPYDLTVSHHAALTVQGHWPCTRGSLEGAEQDQLKCFYFGEKGQHS